MIVNNLNYLIELKETYNIDDEELDNIIRTAEILFVENDINSFDPDMKFDILENWNRILDNKIKDLENFKKVL